MSAGNPDQKSLCLCCFFFPEKFCLYEFLFLARERLRGLQTRPNSHLPAREAPKVQNRHVQIRAPKPSLVSSEQEKTYTNSHPLVEDSPTEDLLAAGDANSGRFGAR